MNNLSIVIKPERVLAISFPILILISNNMNATFVGGGGIIFLFKSTMGGGGTEITEG